MLNLLCLPSSYPHINLLCLPVTSTNKYDKPFMFTSPHINTIILNMVTLWIRTCWRLCADQAYITDCLRTYEYILYEYIYRFVTVTNEVGCSAQQTQGIDAVFDRCWVTVVVVQHVSCPVYAGWLVYFFLFRDIQIIENVCTLPNYMAGRPSLR